METAAPILPTPDILWEKSDPPPPPFWENFEKSNPLQKRKGFQLCLSSSKGTRQNSISTDVSLVLKTCNLLQLALSLMNFDLIPCFYPLAIKFNNRSFRHFVIPLNFLFRHFHYYFYFLKLKNIRTLPFYATGPFLHHLKTSENHSENISGGKK